MVEGDIAHLKAPFFNANAKPVAIEIVSACSCFELDWPRDTLASGEKGEIALTFFSANQEGEHTKTVDVILRNEDERGYPIVEQFKVHVQVDLTAGNPPPTKKPTVSKSKKTKPAAVRAKPKKD